MKTGSFRRTILIGGLFLVLLGAAAAWKYLNGRVSADSLMLSGTIEADEIHIGSKVGGRIAEVLVREGQEVKQGQPIIRFDRYDLDARHADAVAAVSQADANLQKTKRWFRPEEVAAGMSYEQARNGPRKQEIDSARAELKAAEADYEVARLTLTRASALSSNGV